MSAPASTTESSPRFRLRPARRGDAGAIAALLGELGYPQAADVSTVHWVLSHPEIEVIVAVEPLDKPIGLITLSHHPQLRSNGRVASIDELVVTARWRRQGVGRELVLRAIQRARALSAKHIELVQHVGQCEGAPAFSKACGFIEQGKVLVMNLAAKPAG